MNTKKYKAPGYFVDKAEEYGEKYGLKENPTIKGWDDEIDAFRHAYMQAYITAHQGEKVAKLLGDAYEKYGDYTESQKASERNMDLWNNEIGRRIGVEVINEISHFKDITTPKMFEDMIADKIYEKIKSGEIITNPNDTRKYEDLIKGNPTGGAARIEERPFTRQEIGRMTPDEFSANESLIMEQLEKGQILDESLDYTKQFPHGCFYTREDIARMSAKEYEKHEKDILKQMEKQGIPSEKDLPKGEKSGYSKSSNKSPSDGKSSGGSSSGGGSSDGHWVTIKGNHVLIDD